MSESDQSRTFDQSASEGASSSPPYEANQTAPEAGHDASWSAPGSGSASSASQFDSTATGGASGHAGAYRPGSDSREGPDSSWGAPPPRWGQRTSFAPPANGSDQFATPGQPASQASAEWSHASDHSAHIKKTKPSGLQCSQALKRGNDDAPAYTAASASSSSMRSSWLYLATRSERAGAPVLI